MILYLIYGFCMVTCLPFPGLPHIYFLFTARLRIFHVCRNKNFCNRYLGFYWKKWFYIWYMAFAWWIVPCLPFTGLPHIYFLFTCCIYISWQLLTNNLKSKCGSDLVSSHWLSGILPCWILVEVENFKSDFWQYLYGESMLNRNDVKYHDIWDNDAMP